MLNRRIVWKSFDSNETDFPVIGKLGNCTTKSTPTITGMTIGRINHPMMYTLMLLGT
jgi:hypothetical protein